MNDFEGVEILAAEVHPDDERSWARVSVDTVIPTRINATLRIAEPALAVKLNIHVDWAGRGIIREFTVLADAPQPGVSISLLRRIPVDTLMRYAMAQASAPAALRVGPGLGQTGDLPADRIARVAEIYKDAVANGSRSPVDVVISVMGYSSATASRDLKEARRRRLLPPVGVKGGRNSRPSLANDGGALPLLP